MKQLKLFEVEEIVWFKADGTPNWLWKWENERGTWVCGTGAEDPSIFSLEQFRSERHHHEISEDDAKRFFRDFPTKQRLG